MSSSSSNYYQLLNPKTNRWEKRYDGIGHIVREKNGGPYKNLDILVKVRNLSYDYATEWHLGDSGEVIVDKIVTKTSSESPIGFLVFVMIFILYVWWLCGII